MVNVIGRPAATAVVKNLDVKTNESKPAALANSPAPTPAPVPNTYKAGPDTMNISTGGVNPRVAFNAAQGLQKQTTNAANGPDATGKQLPTGKSISVEGVNIDTTGLSTEQVDSLQKSIKQLAKDEDGSKLLKQLQGDRYTIRFDPDYNDREKKNSNAYTDEDTKTIGITELFFEHSYAEQTGILGHETLHAATPGSNSKTEEGLAEVVERRITARANGDTLSTSEEQEFFDRKFKADAYKNLPVNNGIVDSLKSLDITFDWDITKRAQFHASSSNFKQVYQRSEGDTLYTLTTDGNFELTAGNDGNAKTISMKDIQAQIQAQETLIKSPDFFTTHSAEEAAKAFALHNSLKNLEGNFDNYTENNEIDLLVLQRAYTELMEGLPRSQPSQPVGNFSP
ncbi:MAG: hypothetical protein K0Q50_2264 [Vampirovibrio sp.]|jgi:hypothetical protein|nr:hypothetical protein [Vampirovibrio sp.]